jgi:hypothetical protein
VFGGAVAASMALGIACTEGQTAYIGVTEPIQISGAQFIAGDLPGIPPVDGGNVSGGDAGFPPLSFVVNPIVKGFVIPGFAGLGVTVDTTADVVALGVRLADQGTGYWVVPATQVPSPPIATQPASIEFSFSTNFNAADTPGLTSLRVVAIGSDGNAGTQVNAPLCIESRVPDNGHACPSSHVPPPVPAVVITLQWDTNFDVDLNVIVPSGLVVNPKTQLTTVVPDEEGGTALSPPTMSTNAIGLYDGPIGVIDRDSIGSCVIDGWREEDLVFQDPPPPGLYDIYANPFASCGQSSVRFTMTIYERGVDGSLHPTSPVSGELLASQTTGGGLSVTGGAATGLFVLEKKF